MNFTCVSIPPVRGIGLPINRLLTPVKPGTRRNPDGEPVRGLPGNADPQRAAEPPRAEASFRRSDT
jgi:hypothetical protein